MNEHQQGSISRYLKDLREAQAEEELEIARKALWERSFPVLHHLAEVLGAEDSASDLANDGFLRFWRKATTTGFAELETRQHFWALIRKITVNLTRDHFRAQKALARAQQAFREAQPQQAPGEGAQSTDAALVNVESIHDIWDFLAFLDELDEHQSLRSIAFMTYYQGKDKGEICQVLDISERTYYRKLELIRMKIQRFERKLLQKE